MELLVSNATSITPVNSIHIAYSWSIVTPLLGPQSAAQFRTKSEKFDKSTRGTPRDAETSRIEAVGSG